jgi:carboxypeptidase C (cathepsin A)
MSFVSFSAVLIASATSPALILTPYIAKNETAQARNLSSVNSSLFLNVKSHSGFLTVDAAKNSNLFFWYFPVHDKPVNTTPLIVWLQGGPGATSLAGLFEEIGPFHYEDGLKCKYWIDSFFTKL